MYPFLSRNIVTVSLVSLMYVKAAWHKDRLVGMSRVAVSLDRPQLSWPGSWPPGGT